MGSATYDANDTIDNYQSATSIGSINANDLVAGTLSMDGSTIVPISVPSFEIHGRTFATDVVEFNQRVLKIDQRPIGMLLQHEYEISAKCLNEELEEFSDAYATGDLVGMIDAITDLKYFADGILYKMGLTARTIDEVGRAVHEANMEKKLGVNARRGDGSAADAVKPEGWVAPEERIAKILDNQGK